MTVALRAALRGSVLLVGLSGVGTVLYAVGIGPLVQFFLRLTPKRMLAVSGWAAVAQASDLCADESAEHDETHPNHRADPTATTPVEYGTMVGCPSPKEIQPTPTC